MSNPANQRRIGDYQTIDYISNLPDTLLCHILSFVPTKSAVKTSIMSKRWKYVWTKVPALDFTEMPDSCSDIGLTWQQAVCFRSFIDRVLLHHDAPYLQYLCFNLNRRDYDVFYINSWLSVITRREIRKISINIVPCSPRQLGPFVLPMDFLSRERLVVLKLAGRFVLNVQMSLHLPNLEILHLTHLQLPNDGFIKSLISCCPVLQELQIGCCSGITDTLSVESLSLKTLDIGHTMPKTQQACIYINAPNVRYLCLVDGMIPRIVGDLSSLTEAHLAYEGYYDDECALQLVRKVSGVKTLSIGGAGCCELVSKPPIFENLTSLSFEYESRKNYMLLECAPKLKSLTFELVLCVRYSFESRPVLKCLSCLERVEVQEFEDGEGEMTLIAYFLKAASVLKEMKIYMRPMNAKWEREVYQRLLMLPRSSAACQVLVVHRPR